MTDGVCTYSLGKWMGRPKKSGQQTLHVRASETRVARNASLEHENDYLGEHCPVSTPNGHVILMQADRIIHMPDKQRSWELAPFTMEDPIRYPEHAAIPPLSMDGYPQFSSESRCTSTDGSLSNTSSDKKLSLRSTSHHSTPCREIFQNDIEMTNDASVCSCASFWRNSRLDLTSAIATGVSARKLC
jgi:hypothetical protein